ncbi:hypothetical protein DSM07_03425 [Oenococcus sp. UCMA 16435]|nr:hypothetical protein DSM07_03425 [Oenococcus sp. UCMA 16435]MDN6967821.1 hypothetical protein [Oenococcus sp. UCMA 17063]
MAKETHELNQLIIIGNGFDLRCGLPSRFKDFFNYRYGNFNQVGTNFKKILADHQALSADGY